MQINLLPWRDQKRRKAQRCFYGCLVTLCTLIVAASAVWHITLSQRLHSQVTINGLLADYQQTIEPQAAEAMRIEQELNEWVKRLSERYEQKKRNNQVVLMLGEIAQMIPSTSYLTALKVTEHNIRLTGASGDYDQVILFFSKLKSCGWVKAITVESLQKTKEKNEWSFSFGITT